jgi:hypothetical protein
VLKIKKDAATQVSFLDEVMQARNLPLSLSFQSDYRCMQTLENKPSSMFWTSLAIALEKHSKDAASSEKESVANMCSLRS